MVRHFLSDFDLSVSEYDLVLRRAAAMKARPAAFRQALAGKILAMIFQKSSTRTRVSFEAGIAQLGGSAIVLLGKDIQLGRGEPITDTGAVLSRYVDAIMIRTFGHDEVVALAGASTIPVVNGLDDLLHPCQALADALTVREQLGGVAGKRLVFVGDGNNVARSLVFCGARTGMHVRVVSPAGYLLDESSLAAARREAAATGAELEVTTDLAGVDGADVVYTDVWASMGQEAESQKRLAAFRGYQVNAALMRSAKKTAIFLHCLPAHRGEEVTAEVIDGPQSRVFDQAENRLHAQKALLDFLVNGAAAGAKKPAAKRAPAAKKQAAKKATRRR